MSKLWDIVRTVGGAVISNVVPGGAAIVGAVNALLPADSQLPETATGKDVVTAIQSLPPEQRGAVMMKEFEVDITQIKESHSTVRAMLEADAATPHTTRPYIAKGSFHVVAFTIIAAVSIWSYGVSTQNAELVKAVMDGWPFILAVIAPLVILLHAYFGVLRQEQKNRLDAAGGSTTPSGIMGLVTSLIKR